MGTLFVQQGTLMARDLTWRGQTLTIPSASMSTFNTLSIIVLIYVYDKWFEPALKRSPRFRMTLLRRQGGCTLRLDHTVWRCWCSILLPQRSTGPVMLWAISVSFK